MFTYLNIIWFFYAYLLNQPDKLDKTPQKIEADSPDFETTWAQVVAAAKPGNRSLLNRAQIAELSADSCVLAVERK
ncbi:hypothetical protein QT970_30420, partial [Microcoleus sp. herbarium8]